MAKSLLFISIEYPPKSGPGACRNYFFCKSLAEQNWQVNVLTVNEQSLSDTDTTFDLIKSKAVVHKTKAWDSTKLLSLFGKYPKFVEIPDRWFFWLFSAIPKGLKLIKQSATDVIYVSYPSYSNLLVALYLKKRTNKALVLELRDPFRYRYDSKNVPYHWLYRWIEKKALKAADILITTTEECLTLYKNWYPEIKNKPSGCFKNGFDLDIHALAKKINQANHLIKPKKFTLLHSGSLYSIGRNPLPLLNALALLKENNVIDSHNFELIFRACTPWQELSNTIESKNLSDLITFKKSVNYIDSIAELYYCDVIVIIQEAIFNAQIPSKLYDSLCIQKPILAITPPNSALSQELVNFQQNAGSQDAAQIAEHIHKLMNEKSKESDTTINLQEIQREQINKNIATFLAHNI